MGAAAAWRGDVREEPAPASGAYRTEPLALRLGIVASLSCEDQLCAYAASRPASAAGLAVRRAFAAGAALEERDCSGDVPLMSSSCEPERWARQSAALRLLDAALGCALL
jgi:hypothetical protein